MARTNADNPDLSVRLTSFKAIASRNFALIHLKISGFDVDRNNSAMVAFFDLLAHVRLINLITTSSKFFFAVAGLSNCHRLDLASTIAPPF
jgi:hypothetical protein